MGSTIVYREFASRRLARDPVALAAAARPQARPAGGVLSSLDHVRQEFAQFDEHLASALEQVRIPRDFCRRAQSAFRPDGVVDEGTYAVVSAGPAASAYSTFAWYPTPLPSSNP